MPKVPNVVIYAASAVGRSCFIKSATEEDYVFVEKKDASMFSIAVMRPVIKQCIMKDKSVKKLKLWSCRGQERWKSFTTAALKDMTGLIIMYSVDSPESLAIARSWVQSLDGYEGPKLFIVIAANKVDLPDAMTAIKNWKEENDNLCARANEFCPMPTPAFGISNKSRLNIEEVFTAMAEMIFAKQPVAGNTKRETVNAQPESDGPGSCMIQ